MWAIDGAITLPFNLSVTVYHPFFMCFPFLCILYSLLILFNPWYLFISTTVFFHPSFTPRWHTHTQCWSAGNIVTFLLTPNVCFIFCCKKINTLFLWGHGVMLVLFSSLFSCSFQNQFIYCFASFLAHLFCFRFFFVTGFKTRLSNDAQVAHLNAPCV